ncbi:MAG: hypothetical protein SGJ11_07580 [Phycisphaerae bacterium]|nr:hypothetical protein [Phycisphaerae bacterium]
MDEIRALLDIARGRIARARFVRGLHLGIAGAAILLFLLVVFAKTSPAIAGALPWLWLVIGAAVAAIIVGFAFARSSRLSPLSLAVLVDERLALKERLSTALGVKDRTDAFARAAIADAVVVAKDGRTRESLKRGFPVRSSSPTVASWLGPVVAIVAGLCWWFVPQGDFYKPREADLQIAQVQEETRVAEVEVRRAIEKNERLSKAMGEKKLGDLASDNLSPDELPKTPDDMRREAIKKLTATNENLSKILKSEDAKTLESVKNQLAKIGEPRKGSETEELTTAMKAGDFKAAQVALEKLKAEAAKDPAKAAQVQESLDKLADQLTKLADSKENVEKELKQAGLDPKLASSPEALERALENAKNLNEQQKQQIREAAKTQQKAAEKMKELGKACSGACQNGGGQKEGNKPGASPGGEKEGEKQAGGSGSGKEGEQGKEGAAGKAGQKPGGQGEKASAGSMGDMLSDLEALDQMLSDAEAAMAESDKQAEALGQCMSGQCQGSSSSADSGPPKRIDGIRQGGHGRADGGQGQFQKSPTGTKLHKQKIETTAGDIIARQSVEGQSDRGEASVPLEAVIGEITKSMEQGVTEDEIPQHLQELHKTYFGELKSRLDTRTDKAAAPAAAAAPAPAPAAPAGK